MLCKETFLAQYIKININAISLPPPPINRRRKVINTNKIQIAIPTNSLYELLMFCNSCINNNGRQHAIKSIVSCSGKNLA